MKKRYLTSKLIYSIMITFAGTLPHYQVCEREMYPHIDPFVGAFVYIMSWQILLCILAMLLMDAEMTSDIEDTFVGIVLLLINFIMAVIVFLDTRHDVVREQLNSLKGRSSELKRAVRHKMHRQMSTRANPFIWSNRSNSSSVRDSEAELDVSHLHEGFEIDHFKDDNPLNAMYDSHKTMELGEENIEVGEACLEMNPTSGPMRAVESEIMENTSGSPQEILNPLTDQDAIR